MNWFRKGATAVAAIVIATGSVLVAPVSAGASEISPSPRVPAGPCVGAQQINFKTGKSGNLYWYSLQNCFSKTVRVQTHAIVFGNGWSPCSSVAAARTISYSGSVNPFDGWRYC